MELADVAVTLTFIHQARLGEGGHILGDSANLALHLHFIQPQFCALVAHSANFFYTSDFSHSHGFCMLQLSQHYLRCFLHFIRSIIPSASLHFLTQTSILFYIVFFYSGNSVFCEKVRSLSGSL